MDGLSLGLGGADVIREFLRWLADEWRLAHMKSWDTPEAQSILGTMEDPRVATMVVAQRALGRRMKREGKSLLGYKRQPGRSYTPVLTKPTPIEPAPRSAEVYPIRRAQGGSR